MTVSILFLATCDQMNNSFHSSAITKHAVTCRSSEVRTDMFTFTNSTVTKLTKKKLFRNVRLLCWVETWPGKETPVKETWGERCDELIFMSAGDAVYNGMKKPLKVKYGKWVYM